MLARELAKVIKDACGRGPETIALRVSDDVAVAVYSSCLTTAERRLAKGGESDLVRVVRRRLMSLIHDELIAASTNSLGRPPAAVLTDCDPELDLATIVFVLDGTRSADRTRG